MRRYVFMAVIWAIACLVMFAPLRWGLGILPSSATKQIVPTSVSGTFFKGQAGVMLPKTSWPLYLTYRNNVLDGLLGRPFSKLVFYGNGVDGQGHIGLSSGKDIKAELKLSQLPISDPRLAGVAGDVFLTLDALKIDKANKDGNNILACEQAQGRVRTNILAANQSRWQWRGPILSGPVTCDGDALHVALRGSDEDMNVSVDLRLHAEGRYEVNMDMRPLQELPAEFDFVLSALGFETQANGTARLYEQGQIFQGARR